MNDHEEEEEHDREWRVEHCRCTSGNTAFCSQPPVPCKNGPVQKHEDPRDLCAEECDGVDSVRVGRFCWIDETARLWRDGSLEVSDVVTNTRRGTGKKRHPYISGGHENMLTTAPSTTFRPSHTCREHSTVADGIKTLRCRK